MRKSSLILALTIVSSSVLAATAAAEEPSSQALVVPYGLSASVGGGVGGFTRQEMRDLTGTAGLWEVRIMLGTRTPVALELAYQGGMQSIDALGLTGDARLLSTGFEGTVRYNLTMLPYVQPYAFAGAGWTRYDLTNVDLNVSSVEDSDDLLAVPLGLGLAYRFDRLLVDVRGTYRAVFYEDLVPTIEGEHEDMDSWNVALRAGFEF